MHSEPPSEGQWKFVDPSKGPGLRVYPCGAVAGERVRLSKTLVITDHEGNPTGEVHPIGEVWSIIIGIATEPNVVWLREPNGDEHTWDDDTLWEWFKRM